MFYIRHFFTFERLLSVTWAITSEAICEMKTRVI